MGTLHVPGAAQLDDFQSPDAARVSPLGCKDHYPIDVSAQPLQLIVLVAREEYRGAAEESPLGLEPLGEAAEVECGRSRILHDGRAIDDEQRGVAFAHHPADCGDDAVQPLFLQGVEQAQVVDTVTDEVRVEEVKAVQIRQHQVMRLGQEGRDDGTAAVGGMGERQLVAESGLAGSRRAGNQEGAVGRQTATKDLVQAEHTCHQPA